MYSSAWLKCYEPAAFTCALINSQPMGFYATAQLVRDARDHGVEVRPISVCTSDWDCTLERRADDEPALRLGLRLVKHLSEAAAERIMTARAPGAFASVQDLALRSASHTPLRMEDMSLEDVEAFLIKKALARYAGNVSQAANALGLSRSALYRRLQRYGL